MDNSFEFSRHSKFTIEKIVRRERMCKYWHILGNVNHEQVCNFFLHFSNNLTIHTGFVDKEQFYHLNILHDAEKRNFIACSNVSLVERQKLL